MKQLADTIARGVQSPGDLPLSGGPPGLSADPERLRRLSELRTQVRACLSQSAAWGPSRLIPAGERIGGDGDPLPVPALLLPGDPLERAEQAGALLSPFLAPLMSVFLREAVPSALRRWGLGAGLRLLIRRIPADLRREIRVLARAAGIAPSRALALSVMGDFHVTLGCSTLVVQPPLSAPETLLFGRNLDFLGYGLSDAAAILQVHRVPPGSGELSHASLGWAGLWGIHTGWNAAGLCLGNMQVYNPRPDSPRGPLQMLSGRCPTSWAYATLLRTCRTVREALERLDAIDPLSPTNLMMADFTGEAALVEWDIRRRHVRRPAGGHLFATNYFINPEMTDDPVDCWRAARLEETFSSLDSAGPVPARLHQSSIQPVPPSSHPGPHASRSVFNPFSSPVGEGSLSVPVTVGAVRALLHQVNQGELTLHSVVFEPMARRIHVAAGHPPSSQGPWSVLPWDLWN